MTSILDGVLDATAAGAIASNPKLDNEPIARTGALQVKEIPSGLQNAINELGTMKGRWKS